MNFLGCKYPTPFQSIPRVTSGVSLIPSTCFSSSFPRLLKVSECPNDCPQLTDYSRDLQKPFHQYVPLADAVMWAWLLWCRLLQHFQCLRAEGERVRILLKQVHI